MKRIVAIFAAASLLSMIYASGAYAQFSGLPNQGAWNQYLSNHPNVASELQRNPALLYNPNWRSKHPHLEEWLNNHPGDWKAMRQPAPWQSRYGAWDTRSNEWHDQDWWYQNHPEWAHEHHPEWWEDHKDWQSWKKEEQAERMEQKWQHGHGHGHGHDHGHGQDNDND